MNAKRIGVERRLHTVFVQNPQNAPHPGPSAIIVLAGGTAIVQRDYIIFLDRIRTADVMRAPVLGIRTLRPRFEIPRQSDRHPRPIGPLDLNLLRLRVNIVKIIVLRHHDALFLLEKPSKYADRLGIWKSVVAVKYGAPSAPLVVCTG